VLPVTSTGNCCWMAATTAACAGGRSRRPLPGWLARAAVARFEYISGIIRTKTAEMRSRRRFAELTGPRALIDATLPAYDPDDAADDRSPDRESGWTR